MRQSLVQTSPTIISYIFHLVHTPYFYYTIHILFNDVFRPELLALTSMVETTDFKGRHKILLNHTGTLNYNLIRSSWPDGSGTQCEVSLRKRLDGFRYRTVLTSASFHFNFRQRW